MAEAASSAAEPAPVAEALNAEEPKSEPKSEDTKSSPKGLSMSLDALVKGRHVPLDICSFDRAPSLHDPT